MLNQKVHLKCNGSIPRFGAVTSWGTAGDSYDVTHEGHIIGITEGQMTVGAWGDATVQGLIFYASWTWIPGEPIFLSGTGLSQTEPTTGFVLRLGWALTPQSILVDLGEEDSVFRDSPHFDAFQRLRVGAPGYVFDSQLTYDLAPLLFEPATNGAGAAVAHDATNRCALMTFASTPAGGVALMQTFEHFRYQPGRSQGVFLTFNFIEPEASTTKFVGYSDGTNGIEFRLAGSIPQWAILSGSSLGDQIVPQNLWNLDPLDGTGPSKITLDLTKTQIACLDFQALYTGRVRVGFDIGGLVVYVHEFDHANLVAFPYLQTANLPVRAGMTCTAEASTTMRFICSSVTSNGGQDDPVGYAETAEGTGTAGNNARAHILSVRPKLTFNAIANRSKFLLESIELIVTGNTAIYWELVVGQAISGTTAFNDVNASYSAFEFNTAGTISGSPAIVLASGYVSATATNKQAISVKVASRYPITLNRAGAVRALGTMSLLATGLGATSACRAVFNWREIR